jgi:hypothetical protein
MDVFVVEDSACSEFGVLQNELQVNNNLDTVFSKRGILTCLTNYIIVETKSFFVRKVFQIRMHEI